MTWGAEGKRVCTLCSRCLAKSEAQHRMPDCAFAGAQPLFMREAQHLSWLDQPPSPNIASPRNCPFKKPAVLHREGRNDRLKSCNATAGKVLPVWVGSRSCVPTLFPFPTRSLFLSCLQPHTHTFLHFLNTLLLFCATNSSIQYPPQIQSSHEALIL